MLVDKVIEKFKILLNEKNKDTEVFIKIFEIGTGSGAVIISIFFEILNYLIKNNLIKNNINNNNKSNNKSNNKRNNKNDNNENINKNEYCNRNIELFPGRIIKIEIIGIDKFKKPFEISIINFEKILKDYLKKNKELFDSFLNLNFLNYNKKNYYKKVLKLSFNEKFDIINYINKNNDEQKNIETSNLELQILELSFSLWKLDFIKDYKIIKETFQNFDIIFSNPPYISKNDIKKLDRNIKLYEPKTAYFAKDEGDFFYKNYIKIIEEKSFLKNRGFLMFEVGDNNQGERVRNLLLGKNYLVEIEKDLSGLSRILIGYKN